MPAYVALGSNLDDPRAQVISAFDEIAALPATRLIARSRLFRNPALGDEGHPDFVNAVAGLLTRLEAEVLLDALLAIERSRGRERQRTVRWAPRTLDLDLLVYGPVRLETAKLTLPHPGIASRNFVSFPLLDIAPGLHIPGVGPIARVAEGLDRSGLVAISDT